MDSSYIMPFIETTQHVFKTMLQLEVKAGKPAIKKTTEPSYDVSGIIWMSGDVDGSVILSFPIDTARRAVALFAGEELDPKHEDFADAIGELVNMVSGGAKAKFEGKSVSISCPSVVVGSSHAVFSSKDVTTITIPHTSDVGDFAVEVAFRNT